MDADELKHKIPAELRSKIAQAAENPPAFSVGFKSAVALLIVCSIIITCTACYFVFSGENRSESRFNKDAGRALQPPDFRIRLFKDRAYGHRRHLQAHGAFLCAQCGF